MITRECPVHGDVPEKMLKGLRDEHPADPAEWERCPVPTYMEEPCGEPLGPPLRWVQVVETDTTVRTRWHASRVEAKEASSGQ